MTKEDLLAIFVYFATGITSSLYVAEKAGVIAGVVWFVVVMAIPYIIDEH